MQRVASPQVIPLQGYAPSRRVSIIQSACRSAREVFLPGMSSCLTFFSSYVGSLPFNSIAYVINMTDLSSSSRKVRILHPDKINNVVCVNRAPHNTAHKVIKVLFIVFDSSLYGSKTARNTSDTYVPSQIPPYRILHFTWLYPVYYIAKT